MRTLDLLYIRRGRTIGGAMIFDLNLWGIFAMPVGLLLGFGPVLVAWILRERANSAANKPKDRP